MKISWGLCVVVFTTADQYFFSQPSGPGLIRPRWAEMGVLLGAGSAGKVRLAWPVSGAERGVL